MSPLFPCRPAIAVAVLTGAVACLLSAADAADPVYRWSAVEKLEFTKSSFQYTVPAEAEDTIEVAIGFKGIDDEEIEVIAEYLKDGDKQDIPLMREKIVINDPRALNGFWAVGLKSEIKRRRSHFSVVIRPLIDLPAKNKPISWTRKQVTSLSRRQTKEVNEGWWAYDNLPALRREQAAAWARYRRDTSLMHNLSEAQKFDVRVRKAEKALAHFDAAQINQESLKAISQVSKTLSFSGRLAVLIRLNGELVRFDEDGTAIIGAREELAREPEEQSRE
ncbi:MAG: hypothetical protein AAFV43_02515 [Planctomycetota bacterium]